MERRWLLSLVLVTCAASGRARAEKDYPLGGDPVTSGYMTEVTLDQEWVGLDEQVELRQLGQEGLRQIDKDALHANDTWKDGSAATPPVEGADGRIVLDYGAAQYRVVCAPMRVCMVQLQAGETVTDLHAGDTTRWSIDLSTSRTTTYVVIKPKRAGVETNLAIVTDRHTYMLGLVATANDHMGIVQFAYPEDQKDAWRAAIARQAKRNAETPAAAPPRPDDKIISTDPRNLNTRYTMDVENPWFCKRRRTCVDWAPVKVADDGRRTWITMPASIQAKSMPALFLKTASGWELVAFRYLRETSTFYVDRIFSRAQLVLGVNGREGIVTLVRAASKEKS